MVSRKSRRKKNRSKSKASLKKSTSMHRNVSKKLKRVLSHLRNESSCSSQNTTVINLDESLPRKRKRDSELETQRTAKRSHNDSSLIIITDEDTKAGTSGQTKTPNKTKVTTEPLDSSTPLSKPKLNTSNNCLNISNLQKPNQNLTDSLRRDIDELTQDIINESLFTVDLTTGTANNTIDLTNDTLNSTDGGILNSTDGGNNTIIDLDSSVADNNADCTLVSVSDGNISLSMSGESQVTVIQNTKRKKEKRMQRFANGIANMNASEKGRLLELITEKILGGAELSTTTSQSILRHRPKVDRASDTAEDTFIKEVILGQVLSRKNSIGSNIYNPQKEIKEKSGLRMVVIDGSNVAMEHEKGRQFSVRGLKICIDYFVKRGHIVKAFVPRFRCKFGKSTDPRLLDSLERQGLVVYTPSREVQGKFITSYDDRYIVQCAAEFDGVIVSGDNYRDLLGENPRWRHVIENRLLQFTWVGDMIMFPKDPLGRFGPTLEQLLRHGGSR